MSVLGLLIIVGTVGCGFDHGPDISSNKIEAVSEEDKAIVFEEPRMPPAEPEPITSLAKEKAPRIAIIIDDMGYHQEIGEKLIDLPLNLTFSFLPHAPFTQEEKELALRKGDDVLVHLPMEPYDKKFNLGPDALYLATPLSDIPGIIEKNLAAVQGAVGVNNHMGSLYTENRKDIDEVMKVIHDHNMFFVDSYTSSKSVILEEARKQGVRTARRHVFIDNILSQAQICHRLQELVNMARKQGWAIGIGHPNQETLLALTKCLDNLFTHVQLVPVHELVE